MIVKKMIPRYNRFYKDNQPISIEILQMIHIRNGGKFGESNSISQTQDPVGDRTHRQTDIKILSARNNKQSCQFCLQYFLFCIFIVGAQILSAQFFPSIGKGRIGTVVSLSRQVFFLLPLVIVFPLFWGINGVLWAGPVADGLSGILALLLVRREMKKW